MRSFSIKLCFRESQMDLRFGEMIRILELMKKFPPNNETSKVSNIAERLEI